MNRLLLYGAVALAPILLMNTEAKATTMFTLTYSVVAETGGVGKAPVFPDDGASENNVHLNGAGTQSITTLNSPYSIYLGPNAPTTPVPFFVVDPAASCGRCKSSANHHTASDTVKVTFAFTTPTGAHGNFVETAQYLANYSASTDSLDWASSNDPIVASFTDGSVIDISLNDASDWNIAPTISFDMTKAPNVPEPASIAILGVSLFGLGWAKRRQLR